LSRGRGGDTKTSGETGVDKNQQNARVQVYLMTGRLGPVGTNRFNYKPQRLLGQQWTPLETGVRLGLNSELGGTITKTNLNKKTNVTKKTR